MLDPVAVVPHAVLLDPSTVSGFVVILSALTTAIVTVINAIRGHAILKKADVAAGAAASAANQATTADAKLDTITNNVNGNLMSLREELARTKAHNQALQESVLMLTQIAAGHRDAQRDMRALDIVAVRGQRSSDRPVQIEHMAPEDKPPLP